MRKITFLILIFTGFLQAQNFPAPYCDIDHTDVEEITSVEFAGTTITNSDTTSILVNKTDTVISVIPGESYTLEVAGNTDGDFDNLIVAFFDWDQNSVLNDTGEVFEIGTITNSTGNDGTTVFITITIPDDAMPGETRVRITKGYTDDFSTAVIDPCAIDMEIPGYGFFPGYGQALDFTIDIQENSDNFPSPYCDIEDTTVEEITVVEFAGTTILNSDTNSILVNKTDTIITVTAGETYTIKVKGNTYGDFDNNIVAFFDWDQNAILNDEGEVFEVGTITNSTGDDEIFVTMDITIPADALPGETRVRVTKTYTDDISVAEINPCAIEMDIMGMGAYPGFGQAIDFTIDIQENNDGFPSPYCDIEDTTVEEITNIEFAGITITNSDTTSILVNRTDAVIPVTAGETYTISVRGNTYGDFDNNIVAFFDWDQNAILNDEGEVFEVGTITNSTGDDEVFVSMEITVPADALPGETRVRVTKTYTDDISVAEVNPCAIEMDIMGMGAYPGYGQAIDFTIVIETLSTPSFDTSKLSLYPNPTQDVLNIQYQTALQSVTVYSILGRQVLSVANNDSALKLDVSALNSGTYIVKLEAEKGAVYHARFIKK